VLVVDVQADPQLAQLHVAVAVEVAEPALDVVAAVIEGEEERAFVVLIPVGVEDGGRDLRQFDLLELL
jgi:hypothetical protein